MQLSCGRCGGSLVVHQTSGAEVPGLNPASTTPANIKKMKDFRNLYNIITKAAKKRYFEDELSKNRSNLKKTWSLIRQAVKLKSSKSAAILNTILINDVEVHDPLLIAEHLNSFFSSAPALIINNIPPTPEPDPEPEVQGVPLFNLLENEITTLEIVETVKMLEPKNHLTVGEFPCSLLKSVSTQLQGPLGMFLGCHLQTVFSQSNSNLQKLCQFTRAGTLGLLTITGQSPFLTISQKLLKKSCACG